MKTSKMLIFFLVGVFCWFGIGPAQALTMYLDPSSITVKVGKSFSLNLYANAGPTEAILGWDVDLLYDPSQVVWTGTTVNDLLWQAVPSVDGIEGLAGLANFPPTSASGNNILLATLMFECLQFGISDINVGLKAGSDPNQGIMTVDTTSPIFPPPTNLVTSWTALVSTVAQVPEPGTIFLISFGLLGIGLSARRAE